ncbi:hypothetical protein GCM10020229_50130 [Kitasatospora albolonga]
MRRVDPMGAVLGQESGRSGRSGGRAVSGVSGGGRLRVLAGLLLSTVLLAGVQLAEPVRSSAIWG